MVVSSVAPKTTPAAQLRSFLERYAPKEQNLIRSIRSALRKRLPAANELLFDYDDFFVISYSPTDRGIDGIVAIAARTDGMRLYLQGVNLPDPKHLLVGLGNQARFLRLATARQLTHPDVEALIAAALLRARVPLPAKGRGVLIDQSAKKKKDKKRPRQKRAK